MSDEQGYLLDTNTCIHLINGNAKVKARLAQIGVESAYVIIPTISELYFGAYRSAAVERNVVRVHAFLSPRKGPQVLPMDEAAAKSFGRLKADLLSKGQPLDDFDLLIAAVALSCGLTLVTDNTRHFKRVPGLSLENWVPR
jgi:tRNA(fMet)-specific endonuclease VapC